MVRPRRQRRAWPRLTPLVAAFALLVAGCSGGDDATDAAATASSPATATPTASETTDEASPSPTTSAAAEESPRPAVTLSTPPAAAAPESPAATAARPEPVTDLAQGEDVWAVYIAAAPRTDEATLAAARDRATAEAYVPGTGDVDCDQGAQEALGLPDGDYLAVSVLFRTEEDARAFVDLIGGDVAAVARVQVFCLD